VDYKERYRLVIATPSAATKEPARRWVAEADDDHLRSIVEYVFERYGRERIRAFWLVGHSQGGMMSNRLLESDFFSERVDGWLSLSGGRIGPIEIPESFFRIDGIKGRLSWANLSWANLSWAKLSWANLSWANLSWFARPGAPPRPAPGADDGDGPRPGRARTPDVEMSYIFATGENEMVALPETSPWAERYGAGPRVRLDDVVDVEPGQIHDTTRDGQSTPAWGLEARPGTAQVYVYPNARDGRVIADVVRLDKGHTEGLEPRITERLVQMMVEAPGGKARAVLV
jgi:hypothetical protein